MLAHGALWEDIIIRISTHEKILETISKEAYFWKFSEGYKLIIDKSFQMILNF